MSLVNGQKSKGQKYKVKSQKHAPIECRGQKSKACPYRMQGGSGHWSLVSCEWSNDVVDLSSQGASFL